MRQGFQVLRKGGRFVAFGIPSGEVSFDYANALVFKEATVLGIKLGADPQIILDVIGTSFGGSAMMTRNVPRFISRDFAGATPVNLIAKDLGIIHDEARRSGVPILLGALAEQRFLEAQARGWGESDMARLIQLWEEASGAHPGDG